MNMTPSMRKAGFSMSPKILPTVLIIIDVAAAGVYLTAGDWRKVVYWCAAGALTYVVTY